MARMIRALYDFEAGTAEELSFSEGAILTVLEDSNPDWYNADLEGYSGMVPKNYFEEYYSPNETRNSSDGGDEWDNIPTKTNTGSDSKKKTVLIAKVLYTYEARQADELSVNEGETIQILDDSDPDWYSAKPIQRIGDAGLVPKNYCEIDFDTDLSRNSKSGSKAVGGKSSRISLNIGSRESDDERKRRREEDDRRKAEEKATREKQKEEERLERERKKEQERLEREHHKMDRDKTREDEKKRKAEEERVQKERELAEKQAFRERYSAPSDDEITQARVTYFEKRRDGKYYFSVDVYRPHGNNVVYRTYQDFYEFHVKLMECFPEEAGENGRERLIPYLPGQVIFVTEAISTQRRVDLDAYCLGLTALPVKIARSKIVCEFFASRPGDEVEGSGGPPAPWSLGGQKSSADLKAAPKGGPTPRNATGAREGRPPPSRPLSQAPTVTVKPGNYPVPSPLPSSARPGGYASRPAPPPPSGGNSSNNDVGLQRAMSPPLPSKTSSVGPANLNGIKVKVYACNGQKIVALMIQPNTSFSELRDRVFRKLGTRTAPLQYRDEDNDLVTMANNDDIELAISLNPQKLLLYTQ